VCTCFHPLPSPSPYHLHLRTARNLQKIAKEKGVTLYLAQDVVLADKFAPDAKTKVRQRDRDGDRDRDRDEDEDGDGDGDRDIDRDGGVV
jgi:hypothetical protein